MLILADGFDFYTSVTDAQYAGSPWAASASINNGGPYGVGQSASAAGNGWTTIGLSNDTTIYFALSLFTGATFISGNTQGFHIDLYDGTAIQCTLTWGQDGNFMMKVNGWNSAIIAGTTFPHGMAANSWCHWQVKVVINNTTGSVELRKNNNPINDFTKTGINTRNGTANNYANKYDFMTIAPAYSFDDLFMCSATGAAPNNWPGQLRAVQLMASADVQKVMAPLTGTTNFSMVSELHMDSDTSYVFSSNPGDLDIYALQDLSVNPAAIPLVVSKVAMRKTDTGSRTACSRIVSGAFAQDQPTVNLATTYSWQMSYFPLDPNTSAAWTQAGVNALQLGAKVVA